MKKELNVLNKEIEETIEEVKTSATVLRAEHTDDGRAIIKLNVHNADDFLSPYSSTNQEIISTDVAEFLENGAQAILPKEKLKIEISSDVILAEQKPIYKDAIKNYYTNLLFSTNLKLRKLFTVSIFLAVIAIAFIAFSFMPIENNILGEALSIIGCFFMWEAIDIYAIQRSVLKLDKRRYMNFINAEIVFIDN